MKSLDARAPWAALVLDVPRSLEETAIGIVAAGSLGVERVRAARGRVTLRVYWADRQATAAAEARLRACGLGRRARRLRVEPVGDGRWVERYQASLAPFRLGKRFLVEPRGAPAAEANRVRGRRVLRLVPGRAFGTGEHPTTQLCAAMLERYVEPGSRWLDLGCGTAVLALVASACGAAEVLALDVDVEAVRVARRVLAANPARGVTIARGSIGRAARRGWDGVVTNIDAGFLVRRAPGLARLLGAGGRLVASGFLVEQEPRVRAALVRAGILVARRSSRGGWVALVGRRPA